MNFTPTIHYHSKNDIPNAPLALRDFLSLRKNDKYFAEKYVIEILKHSRFFQNQDLTLVEIQNDSQPDVVDNLNKTTKYEIKTFWNQEGCEMLSLGKNYKNTFKALSFNESLKHQLINWNKPENYNQTSKSIIEKMKKKPMNYILFMINTFCLDDDKTMMVEGSEDVDVLKWQFVLKSNSFDFKIFIIKPTLFNKFAIYCINKVKIEKEILNYNDFFEKYITVENISLENQ